jgi:hypothetical protein
MYPTNSTGKSAEHDPRYADQEDLANAPTSINAPDAA